MPLLCSILSLQNVEERKKNTINIKEALGDHASALFLQEPFYDRFFLSLPLNMYLCVSYIQGLSEINSVEKLVLWKLGLCRSTFNFKEIETATNCGSTVACAWGFTKPS